MNQDKQLMAILDLKRDGKIEYDQDFFDEWHLKRGMKEDQRHSPNHHRRVNTSN